MVAMTPMAKLPPASKPKTNPFADMLEHLTSPSMLPTKRIKKPGTLGDFNTPTSIVPGGGGGGLSLGYLNTPIVPPVGGGAPLPNVPIRGATAPKPLAPSAPSPFLTAGGAPQFGGYDASGVPIYSQMKGVREGDVPGERFRDDPPIVGDQQPPPSGGDGGVPPPDGSQPPPSDTEGGGGRRRSVGDDPSRPSGEDLAAYQEWLAQQSRPGGHAHIDLNTYRWIRAGGTPDGMENPEVAAQVYSIRGGPGFETVSGKDVDAYRQNPLGHKDFVSWWNNQPVRYSTDAYSEAQKLTQWLSSIWGGNYQVTPEDVTGYRANNFGLSFDAWMTKYGGAGWRTPTTPVPDGATPPPDGPGGGGGGGGAGGGGGGATPPPDGPAPPPGPGTPTNPDGSLPPRERTPPPPAPQLTDFNELLTRTIGEIENRYDPLFQKQQDDLQRRLTHIGATTGAVDAGGFTESVGNALSGLQAEQGAQLGQEISALTQSGQALATQRYVSELDAAVRQEQIRTNADVESWALDLQKYGIDKNDLMERYKSELALRGVMYSADAQVNAAALHAAASQAAAVASADASRYAADQRLRSDILGADVMREGNIMDYIMGFAALGPEWARWILGADPFGIISGAQPPGDVIVTP